MIGKAGNSRATSSSWLARCRCCQSGLRWLGLRRGSSRARAAHSRNRLANIAEPPTSTVTSSSSSSFSNRKKLGARRLALRVGQPHDDAIVGGDRGAVKAVAFANAR